MMEKKEKRAVAKLVNVARDAVAFLQAQEAAGVKAAKSKASKLDKALNAVELLIADSPAT